MNDAEVRLIGNVTRDPEFKVTQGGQNMATFGVAINKRQKNPDTGQWENGEPEFHDVVCWRDLAENVVESITKGTRVVVVGRLSKRSWEGEDGKKQYRVEVVADEVAPSLRWAVAEVSKTTSSGGGNYGGGGGYSGGNEPF
jgi:single-strand DNA-binding protein